MLDLSKPAGGRYLTYPGWPVGDAPAVKLPGPLQLSLRGLSFPAFSWGDVPDRSLTCMGAGGKRWGSHSLLVLMAWAPGQAEGQARNGRLWPRPLGHPCCMLLPFAWFIFWIWPCGYLTWVTSDSWTGCTEYTWPQPLLHSALWCPLYDGRVDPSRGTPVVGLRMKITPSQR